MDFGSYRDDVVLIASALVNHLTEGVDGTRSYEVPVDARARRARPFRSQPSQVAAWMRTTSVVWSSWRHDFDRSSRRAVWARSTLARVW